MGYKTITDLNADITISLGGTNRKTNKKNPTEVEGYYLGNRQVVDNKKKSGFSYIYFFQTPKGNIGVWGKTDMDTKMKQATVGYMTLVQFDKMVSTPNGEMYKYIVGQDSDNSIEVAQIPATNTEVELDQDLEESVEDEEDTRDALSQVAALAVERKAKIDTILKRRG